MDRVVSFGSINVDRYVEVDRSALTRLEDRYTWFPAQGETVSRQEVPADFPPDATDIRPGGKGANQAIAAARAGAAVAMLGKVGPDAVDLEATIGLGSAGVSTDAIETAAEPTGTAFVFVGADGDNRIVVRPGANRTIDEAYVRRHLTEITDADCLLLQNEIPVAPVAFLLDKLAAVTDPPVVILDPAPPDGVGRLLTANVVTYLTPNEREYEALRESLARFDGWLLRKRGEKAVIVEDGESFTVNPPAVSVVDTTGAGDVFNGFLGARLAAGVDLRSAVETATVAGALSVSAEGAQRAPTIESVRAFAAADDD